jgi:hypothetical protein
MMSMNHGVTTVSNAASAKGGCSASAATSARPHVPARVRRVVATPRDLRYGAGAIGYFVQFDRTPGEYVARSEQQQRIEVRGNRQRAVAGGVQIVTRGVRHRRRAPAFAPSP